ncbi:hypothetical protein K7432_000209 [Basidiobolus ranarum]|uniref:Uncharacterized protein n=1 Tax=Basidiobolus ranarum TaxID=34480 RepID=A0ABR2WBK9_9FUNG
MVPLRAALLLSFILAFITPSSAVDIFQPRVVINGTQQVATLSQFAYAEGGRGRVFIDSFSGIPENYPNRHFFKFIAVEQSDWSTVEATVSSSEKSYCELDRVFWGKSTIYWNELDYSLLQGTLNYHKPVINFEIDKAGVYNMMFLNCGNFRVEFWCSAAFFNVINGTPTDLPYGSTQLPTIYVIFGFGVWPILTLPWAINRYRHRELQVNLHWLYSLHPLLQVIFCLFSAFTFLHRRGEEPQRLDVFRGCVMFTAAFSYFLFRLYVSKGYGITRLKLSSHESRAVFGVATFAAVAESAQQIIGGSSVIGVFVFYFLFYFYLYWNSRMHLRLLRIYIFKLRERSSRGLLVKVYYKKYKLIL